MGSASFIIRKSEEEDAALKIQKAYRGYRTRRKLALWWQAIDLLRDFLMLNRNTVSFSEKGFQHGLVTVPVEELWWQALDFVMLERNNKGCKDIVDSETPETAVSRWLRGVAIIKSAKIGNGLSKDDKALKLFFEHWLEAIDPPHRYGRNLYYYCQAWCKYKSVQGFFYWLDFGDGRNFNLDSCSRATLQQQRIKYLGPKEREKYEVKVVDGKLLYTLSGDLVDTRKGSKESMWIVVLSPLKKLYVAQKEQGTFQHSSFLAGAAVSAAGRLDVHDGILKSFKPYSGHYRPTEEHINKFISFLKENNVDLTNVQVHNIKSKYSTKGYCQTKILKIRIKLYCTVVLRLLQSKKSLQSYRLGKRTSFK